MMVQSVRLQLPRGLTYEFVIVDGGSSDGTIAWCEAQADIRLIQHGALLGAIKAFTEGCYAATGEYVAILNDDVIVFSETFIRAIAHLETHAFCAMVAFADNRTSQVTGTMDGKDYRVEAIGVTLPDGNLSMVPYGQCCLVRKALGDAADWWHASDPVIGKSRVYGGDSALSSWLWEHGWTVDAVEGCKVEDLIVRDGLRAHNGETSGADSGNYYKRYPAVHIPADRAVYDLPERLRVLFLPVYEAGAPQSANVDPKWLEAFQAIGALVLEIDYLNDEFDLPALCASWQPDVLLLQMQGFGRITPQMLADARAAHPHMVIVNWNGDATLEGLLTTPVLDLLAHVDLQTTVNAAALSTYKLKNIPAAYWQIGYVEPVNPLPEVPHWDVVFTANWYEYREPLFKTLHSLPRNIRFGSYGNDSRAVGNCHYDFAMQAALYQSATIVIGDTFPFGTKAFVSNRLFNALAHGAFLLQQKSPALDRYTGLLPGVHYAEWDDVNDLREKIIFWLQPEQEEARQRIAQAGRDFVRTNFSFDAQIAKLLLELIPQALYGKLFAA
jgi:glycosyltransferase involved in cell wall biosynthesis